MQILRSYTVLLAILALCFIQNVSAAFPDPIGKTTYLSANRCGENSAQIIFVNGIWNAVEDALASRDTLTERFYLADKEGSFDLPCYTFKLGYNHSAISERPVTGYVFDLSEAFTQFVDETQDIGADTIEIIISNFWRAMSGILPKDDTSYLIVNGFFEYALPIAIENAASAHHYDAFIDDKSLQALLNKIREYRDEGKPTLLVSHSQGNYYANRAITKISGIPGDPDLVSMVGVATPTSTIEGPVWHVNNEGDKHVTIYWDAILAVPGSLRGNVSNGMMGIGDPPPQIDPIGIHSFIDSYMAGMGSREAIFDLMVIYLTEFVGNSGNTLIKDVVFADFNLRQCVFNEAASRGWKTVEEVSELSCFYSNISKLAGVEAFSALEILDLNYNSIIDLTPLAGLTALQRLYLGDNNISDLTPLAELTALQMLDLKYNNISDLTPLAELTALRSLYLSSNSISDVSLLAGLTALRNLALDGNNIPCAQLDALRAALGLASITGTDECDGVYLN